MRASPNSRYDRRSGKSGGPIRGSQVMRQSQNRQAPVTIALGGVCLFSLGLAGCGREAGLNLAKSEARTDSVITERANDSIVRSKQELASPGGKSSSGGLAGAD